MRSIGTSVSSAVIGMVLAHMSQRMGPATVPTMAGFRVSFLIATAAVALGVALASFLPSPHKPPRPTLLAQSPDDTDDDTIDGPGRSADDTSDDTDDGTDDGADQRGDERGTASDPRSGFRGRVLGSHGGPVPGASVTLIDHQGRQAGVTTAAGDGRYALAAPAAGTYVLTGAAPGHAPYAASATYRGAGATAETDLVLTPGGRLRGTLRGGPEGAPLAGGGIVVTDATGEVVARTASGPEGRWEVAQLPFGSYTLVLSAPGHQPQARAVDVSGAAGRERQDVRLRPAATVRGTVRGPGGRPLADAAMTLLADGTVTGHTVTGPDGAFAFSGLSGSRYTLTAAGYPPHATPVSLAAGAEETLDLTLTQPSTHDG
jgi:protocatechuate 3,4-dioxygenase beta subunit